ncbi:DUF6339 family protein [Sporosarcina saromensis]|uniref:DUF6339 family protein n=1 Tax=Sporosarcina saromensis TaxID=359365 RepID=A0ABU4GAD8_9BACL|nr:DUF6339 family protein [Sporosarcina saromensis]MDW0113273.1 DUF6339 family protein [Sporosarcina saromensis]
MKIKFLSENTLQDLRVNYDTYKEHYYSKDNTWFNGYFAQEGATFESDIDYKQPNFNFNSDYLVSDFENVKIVYEALQHLTVAEATHERLWAGLAHMQMREFSYYRLSMDLEKKNDKRIQSALFFTHGAKRSLYVHLLARLWWVGYMTDDEANKEDPYWLTEFFSSADFSARCVVFFSSNFTSNRNITKGVLRALITLKNEGFQIKREHFVEANRYLNILGGAMILDMLKEDEVLEIIMARIKKVYNLDKVAVLI